MAAIVVGHLRDRLPPSWSVESQPHPPAAARRPDAMLTVRSPDGASSRILVEAKRLVAPRDVPHLIAQLGDAAAHLAAAPAAYLVIARYLPPSARSALADRGIGYADATGNLRLSLESPALFLQLDGLDRDPWRGPGRPLSDEQMGSYLLPRGVESLADALRTPDMPPYVLTGSLAAHYFAPYAPARLAMLHVDNVPDVAAQLDLRPVEQGANVLLAASSDGLAFERATERDGILVAAPSQIAVDLLTGPGRSPAEGVALLDWMEANEDAWRL